MEKSNTRKYAILILFLTGLVLFHKFCYIGHYGYDDMQYAKMASDFLQGTVNYDDHFSYRTPVVLPTALSYSLFGVSDLASAIPPLITTAFILIILFLILRKEDWKTILIALSLTTFSTWFIFWSDKLSSDIYIAFSLFASLAVLYKYKYDSDKKYVFLYAFLFAAALFWGFLAKEVVVLMTPLLLYFFIWDMIHKQDRKFWIYSILSGAFLLIAYFFIIWLLTGNFLTRFEAIVNNSYLNLCSYDQQSLRILLKRIAWDFWDMCIYQNMIIGFVFILAYFFQKNVLTYFKMKDSFSFFFVSSVILILSCNFMTISFTSYSPMCIDPRHYLFLIPIVSIPASIIIMRFIEEKKQGIFIFIILLGVSLIAYFSGYKLFTQLYLPLTILFCLYLFLKPKKIFQILFVGAFVIILFMPMINWIKYAPYVQYRTQKEYIFEQIIRKNEQVLVITDKVQKRLGEYYIGFDVNSPIKFITYDEFEKKPTTDRKNILLYNRHTIHLSGLRHDDLPYYVRNVSALNNLLFEDNIIDMYIYEMIDLSEIDLSKYPVFQTINDFESPLPYWSDNLISTEIKHGGEKSNKLIEYSSTFEYPLDSLHFEGHRKLLIACNLDCYFESPTKAQIVIAIENDGETYIWRSFGINNSIRAYSNWWPVKCETEILIDELKENSVLKVYVWNEDQKTGYVDNFEVRLVKL
ncbi:MAG: glycosyltransferase family 39 protein [Bacteroidetes bacterium]|nr:glycosyltransferase family 39 protein [Bacteroidota bacterium]MCL2301985.1 glycosyltransferase family 39 protein [Lentimicrobiaceae bacterium]